MKQTIYEHTQPGVAMLILVGIPLVIMILSAPLAPVLFVLAILIAVMVIFHSMTVKVDAERVTLHFGLGAFRRSFPVREIREACEVRNAVWHGLGIHFIPGGMVYNVSGFGAVEIVMADGHRYRIGSDEPAVLLRAIEEAMTQR